MTLDHLGIAAAPGARELFARLLGAAPYKIETVESQGVATVFFGDGGRSGAAPKLELLESVADGSPIARHLERRGPGLHHVAFEVADLEAEMERVRALGVRLLSEAPQPGADGKRIVFLHPKDTGGVLVELCQSAPPARETLRAPWRGAEVVATAWGDAGAPVLLALHGAAGTADQLAALAARWARDWRVVAPDLAGHGRTADPGGAPTWDAFADGVEAALDAFDLGAPAAFGYSLGGAALLRVATRRPGAFSRLWLHATGVQWTARHVAAFRPGLDAAALSERARAALAEAHGDRWERVLAAMTAFGESLPGAWIPDDELAAVAAPTHVSVGDADPLFSVADADALRTALGARLSVLPGVTHALSSLGDDAFATTVDRSLRSSEALQSARHRRRTGPTR